AGCMTAARLMPQAETPHFVGGGTVGCEVWIHRRVTLTQRLEVLGYDADGDFARRDALAAEPHVRPLTLDARENLLLALCARVQVLHALEHLNVAGAA